MDTRKIVINRCYGGFGLSEEASKWLRNKGVHDDNRGIARDNPALVECVEELGSTAADGRFSSLGIVEIPADVDWQIDGYDGIEWVAEKHRTWGKD